MMAMMWIGTVIWLGILVALALAVSAWFRHIQSWRQAPDDPVAILQLRLARGDISLDEYQDLRQHMEKR